jgi:GTP cyclohydrolase I
MDSHGEFVLRADPRLLPGTGGVTREDAEAAVATLIAWAGDDPLRPELEATPSRVATSFGELFAGYSLEPDAILRRSLMPNDNGRQVVLLRGMRFVSFCEHHLLPFTGHVHLAYMPDRHLVGIGSIAAALDALARRLQVQERLTDELASAVQDAIAPLGTAVMVTAEHLCMSARGTKCHAAVVTTRFLGSFVDDASFARDFLMMLGPTNPGVAASVGTCSHVQAPAQA